MLVVGATLCAVSVYLRIVAEGSHAYPIGMRLQAPSARFEPECVEAALRASEWTTDVDRQRDDIGIMVGATLSLRAGPQERPRRAGVTFYGPWSLAEIRLGAARTSGMEPSVRATATRALSVVLDEVVRGCAEPGDGNRRPDWVVTCEPSRLAPDECPAPAHARTSGTPR